jgi:hypothetical protein
MAALKNAKPMNAETNYKAAMEGRTKIGRPRKRWTDKVEEDLNTMEGKDREAMVRDRREERTILLEAKVHNGI